VIQKYFGYDFASREYRIESYEFLENFILELDHDWSTAPDTDSAVKAFITKIDSLSNQSLAFLICHTGYIPELYGKDSSQETLYTKLIETVVLVWAKRIGFSESALPTQKSSKEDITIMDTESVIVSDAKSFRLGRSQAAPNVKDTLKSGDIKKWLSAYPEKKCLGGLVTFPSQHDWQKGSDFYQYLTDKTNPILSLFYEHLAFILLSTDTGKENLISTLESYSHIFPEKLTDKNTNKTVYFNRIEKNLFSSEISELHEFKVVCKQVISECVRHSLDQLDTHINRVQESIQRRYLSMTDLNVLREKVIESEQLRATSELEKQRANIARFRTPSDEYLSK